ncbi:MAG: hypothetical protein ACFN24_02845 [Candidatus Nanogingivalis sp.]
MNQQFFLQEELLRAITTGTLVRLEADGNKAIYISPKAVYDLDKEIVEIHGSAEIVYLGGIAPNRHITRREIKKIVVRVDENFKVVKMLNDKEIPHRIEETLKILRDSQEELEIPPFLRN